MKKYLRVCGVLCAMLLCCGLISGCGNGVNKETAPSTELGLPWNNGGKQPSEYTWEEFENLDGGLQIAFQRSFDSMEGFNQWMMTAKGVNTLGTDPEAAEEENHALELPWEIGGKQPSEYTWEEFLALDGDMQMAFQQSFTSYEDFEAWLQKQGHSDADETEPAVEEMEDDLPWENGGKQSTEYTWEEFLAMDGDMQMAFQQSFASYEDFEAWLQEQGHADAEETEPSAEEMNADLPWENGGKQPSEYTWEEFLALDGGLQIAFQNSFASYEDFDEWFQRVNPQ